MIEFAFVVQNLETGEESNWIQLDTMSKEEARQAFDAVIDTRFDWEIVDIECPFSINYYDYRFADFETLYEVFEILSEIETEQDILIAEHLLDNEGMAVEELPFEIDNRTVFFAGQYEEDLAYAYVDEVGIDNIQNMEMHFDFESFGRDLRLSGFVTEMEEENPALADEMMEMRDDELGEYYVDNFYGSTKDLPQELLETHFDYNTFGRDLAMDYTYVEIFDLEGWVSDY